MTGSDTTAPDVTHMILFLAWSQDSRTVTIRLGGCLAASRIAAAFMPGTVNLSWPLESCQ